MLFDRALVLPPTTTVRMEVSGDRPAALDKWNKPVADLDVEFRLPSERFRVAWEPSAEASSIPRAAR